MSFTVRQDGAVVFEQPSCTSSESIAKQKNPESVMSARVGTEPFLLDDYGKWTLGGSGEEAAGFTRFLRRSGRSGSVFKKNHNSKKGKPAVTHCRGMGEKELNSIQHVENKGGTIYKKT